jgi:hypothetical protein
VSVFGMVTIASFVCSTTGAGLLAALAISLRIQGDDTQKQVWNRRMLAGGSLSYFTGLFLPFAFLSTANASVLSVGVVVLGALVTALVILGRLRRALAVLCLLSAGLLIGLTPHLARNSLYAIALLVGGGMMLTFLSNLVDRYVERERDRSSSLPRV